MTMTTDMKWVKESAESRKAEKAYRLNNVLDVAAEIKEAQTRRDSLLDTSRNSSSMLKRKTLNSKTTCL